jgi:leader peptidase (prepilin peptidase)/N-methyltransferase
VTTGEIALREWYLISAGLVGLVVGSFLNVVIHRLPRMLERRWHRECAEASGTSAPETAPPYNLARPGSHCPACGRPIPPWANIPVLSWILLGGRCHDCKAKISLRYPLVELASAGGAILCAMGFATPLQALGAMLLFWMLMTLALIDFDHQILPDAITLPGIWLGLALNSWGLFVPLRSALWGAILGYLFLWAVYQSFRLLTGKEGLGYGDFKLLALLGAWLGAPSLIVVILLASVIGALTGILLILTGRHRRGQPMPFGPFLAGAGLVSLAYGGPLLKFWLHLIHPA